MVLHVRRVVQRSEETRDWQCVL